MSSNMIENFSMSRRFSFLLLSLLYALMNGRKTRLLVPDFIKSKAMPPKMNLTKLSRDTLAIRSMMNFSKPPKSPGFPGRRKRILRRVPSGTHQYRQGRAVD